jgi:hypothetical protein
MSDDLIQAQSWLKEHVQEGKSVTELEILHGVLNDPQMATHAFFYFRDPVQARGRTRTRRKSSGRWRLRRGRKRAS